MTDDTTLSDATWQYDVDSNQRDGVTATVNPDAHASQPTDDHEADDDDPAHDRFGIPTGLKQ